MQRWIRPSWWRPLQPDAVRDALTVNAALIAHAGHPHGGGDLTSVRDAEYKGHRIVVRTTYEITVDGRPFVVHLTVDNAGRVHYHGLPTRDFASVVGLVQKAIDVFPCRLPRRPRTRPRPRPGPRAWARSRWGALTWR